MYSSFSKLTSPRQLDKEAITKDFEDSYIIGRQLGQYALNKHSTVVCIAPVGFCLPVTMREDAQFSFVIYRGSFATVFEVTDKQTNKNYAAKVRSSS